MRLILWEQFQLTHQISDRVRVECSILNCFLGGRQKDQGSPCTACDIPRVRRSKTCLIKYLLHQQRGPFDLIASSADAKGVDNFLAVSAQFYFDGVGLSCSAMK